MHELSIANNIVTIVEEEYKKLDCNGMVQKVYFNTGRMNAIIPDSLKFGFNTIKQNKVFLKEAELIIIESPIILKCKKCNIEKEIDEPFFICEKCGSTNIEVISGMEMYIDSIEVDDNCN